MRYGREEATLRKSVCFDKLRSEVRRYARVRVSVQEVRRASGYRSNMKTRGGELREENGEVMA